MVKELVHIYSVWKVKISNVFASQLLQEEGLLELFEIWKRAYKAGVENED